MLTVAIPLMKRVTPLPSNHQLSAGPQGEAVIMSPFPPSVQECWGNPIFCGLWMVTQQPCCARRQHFTVVSPSSGSVFFLPSLAQCFLSLVTVGVGALFMTEHPHQSLFLSTLSSCESLQLPPPPLNKSHSDRAALTCVATPKMIAPCFLLFVFYSPLSSGFTFS